MILVSRLSVVRNSDDRRAAPRLSRRILRAGCLLLGGAWLLGAGLVLSGRTAPAAASTPSAVSWLSPVPGARFVQALREGHKVTLVTMGTSLTGGAMRWPDVLQKDWLEKEWPGRVTLFNEGVGASSSRMGPGNNPELSGLGKLAAVIAHQPDAVFMEFAINDAFLPYQTSVDESKKNLETMIDRIQQACPGVEVILLTMNSCLDQPGGGQHASDRPQLAAYYEGYREVARQRHLLLVDLYPQWLKLMTEDLARFDRLVPDRIHPGEQAYREVALPVLRDVLRPPRMMDTAPAGVAAFFQRLGADLRLLVCGYEDARLVIVQPSVEGGAHGQGAEWRSEVRASPVPDDADALDLAVSFQVTAGVASSSGVAVALDLSHWSTNHYLLIPASVYRGNRNRVEPRPYAAGLDRQDLYRKDLPLTTGELPQLSPEPGRPSKIEVNTSNVTTPAMAVFDPAAKRGLILLTEQGSRWGDHGLIVEESLDRGRATLVVSAPGVRERKPEFIGFSNSPDRGARWSQGEKLTVRLRLYALDAPDIPALLDKLMTVRKAVTGPNQPRDLLPFSEVIRLMMARIDSRYHEGKEYQFYCPENAAWISFGWVGGLMDTYPMLALGDDLRRARVASTFNFAIPRAQGKAGYFYGALNHDGKVFGREGYDEDPRIVLTRKNADVLWWMVKQFQLLRAQGQASAIQPAWETNTRRLAEAFVDTWKRCGQWGNFVHVDTGEVVVYNSTGGAQAIGALAHASRYFQEPAYMTVAKEAADYYYDRDFVRLGLTTGGCADILQNADSESAAQFMTSLMALYETTGEARWLERSRNLANLFATWVVSHDYQLPADTELARLGAKLTGVVWASTQNKHGAPGSCTSSCDPLLKIYRATGDRRYADLLRDIVHAHAEGIKPDGQITERLTFCDADSRGSRGDGSTGWCELNGFLMALELPGIYVRTDLADALVFDHVRVQEVRRIGAKVQLRVHNPTSFPARVKVLAEDAVQRQTPLAVAAFLRWPEMVIPPGEVREMTVP